MMGSVCVVVMYYHILPAKIFFCFSLSRCVVSLQCIQLSSQGAQFRSENTVHKDLYNPHFNSLLLHVNIIIFIMNRKLAQFTQKIQKQAKQLTFQKMYTSFKHPKTELGQMAQRVCIGLGICTIGITASLMGLR